MKDIKVGDIVNYHSIIGGKVTSSGHKITAVEKRYEQWIAWITGKPACVSIEALSKEGGTRWRLIQYGLQ